MYRRLLRPVDQDVDAQIQKPALYRASLLIHQVALMIARAVIDGSDFHHLAAEVQNHVRVSVPGVYHIPCHGDEVRFQHRDLPDQILVVRAEFPVMQIRENRNAKILPASDFRGVQVVKGYLQLLGGQPPAAKQQHGGRQDGV